MQKLNDFLKKNWVLLLILFVAAFLRFYQLNSIPPGLYPDEAANGLDIIRMMDDGDFRAIYDTNGPRESLFFFAQGLFVFLGKTFNISSLDFTPLALRIAPAFIGVLTVWGTYLMAKEFFRDKQVGLIAAAAMAVSAWHIQFSRNGFRAIMLPMALTFMFYFFIKAYREGKLKDYLWFATFLAIGFYTYLSIRMIPLVFGALFVWLLVFDKGFVKKNIKKLLYTGALFLALLIPLFISFAGDITLLAGRASTSIFNPEFNNGSPALTFLDNIKKEVLMFNFAGDENFRHNFGGAPMLDIAVGIFFWIGATISVIRWKKLEHFTLIMLFVAMSLPMILTAEGIPHALRLVGVMPVVFIWVALGIKWVADRIKPKNIRYAFIVLILLLSGVLGFKRYFIDFPNTLEAHEAYSEDMVAIANDLTENGQGRQNILVVGEFGTKTIDYIIDDKNVSYLRYETYNIADNLELSGDSYTIYVQENWLGEAERGFLSAGYWFDLEPVKSEFDGRVLYYKYESN
ncbi:MAG: glycosyltransferase family 39 protein [Patescibacteria group bacterium]|nr:glycosyltransferase family 39 protein [Patescibacteria group bacterium]